MSQLYWQTGSILFSVIAVLLRYALFDQFDPSRCEALTHQGSWLDHKLTRWQPHGCMLHEYRPQDGSKCLGGGEVVFIGDSVTRNLFFQFASILDPSIQGSPVGDEFKHQDHSVRTKSGTNLFFAWDPFLNGTKLNTLLYAELLKEQKPALLVVGGGLWYLRYAPTSGGLPAYEANTEKLFHRLGIQFPADEVVMLPIEDIVTSKLSPERAGTMHHSDIDAMNSDLIHRVNPYTGQFPNLLSGNRRTSPVWLPMVFNQMLHPAATVDGIHFSDSLVKTQANILLNLRCNNELPKLPPMDKTCCRSYPNPVPVQALILGTILLWGPVALYTLRHRGPLASQDGLRSGLILSAALAIVYLADRSGLWLKEHKNYSPTMFGGLSIFAVVAGLYTMKRGDKDLGFLNRDQTDEWKGWMQLMILIYHLLGASKISGIYNPIRVLVASYLFMTGYGHVSFYLLKADYSFSRVAQILVRTNILTVLLAFVMGTDYMLYYFSALVTFWFLVTYATMAVGAQYNTRTPLLVAKLTLACIAVALVAKQEWLTAALFDLLERVSAIRWSAREWGFRVTLDLYIVFVGQLAAVAVIKCREHKLVEHRHWPTLVKGATLLSGVVLVWFFAFELGQESKFTYNTWHPYISWLPVLAFAVLRNATPALRSMSSDVFIWAGKCSLELFILQFHFFLAADTKGVLVVIPGPQWRLLNLLATSIAFISISHLVAEATGDITKRICVSDVTRSVLPVTAATDEQEKNEQSTSGLWWWIQQRLPRRLLVILGLLWIANVTWRIGQ
ncbi:unnamed protein product [Mycena citricolor]|uniref:Cas1p 10 TM acyl transferase domain-containing protein n=1 Tax=Mycena citricolor TaxID=2018698 RepID=A0AAD2JVP0_9AGAR|nr:unnamed protein product [Mycena citricolor]